MADADGLTPAARDRLLAKIRGDYEEAFDIWSPIHANGKVNMRFIKGDPWDPAERQARAAAGRPCVSYDEINQHTNQVVNDARSNKRGVKFSPTGRGANDKTAEFYQDKMREIEYRSNGQIVYTTAFQNGVERSYGACRVKTKYVPGTFLQEIWLEEFVNPDCVLPGPAKRPTTLDKKYCFVQETRRHDEFKREFPEARLIDFSPELMQTAKLWIRERDLTIAEYWTVEDREKELAELANGKSVYVDELDAKQKKMIARRRMDVVPYVCSYWTNGVELLRPRGAKALKTEWAGKYIPIIFCVGKVIYTSEDMGTKFELQAMTDLMRDPQMGYAYTRTNQVELVGMTPKTPFVGYVGQFRGHEEKWANVNKSPLPYIEANATTEATGQSTILPLPQRPADVLSGNLQALELMNESQIRAVRSAAGSTPLPNAAQRRSEKSKVALDKIEQLAKAGSYHFFDHYNDMIEAVGVVCEDIFEHIYDTPRDVVVRRQKGAKEESVTVRINDPRAKDGYPSIKGNHQVTVSTGPSFENEQEAGSDLADSLMAIGDVEVLRAVLPLAVKLKNQSPIAEEMVEILEVLQPPPVQALRESKAQGQDPARLSAQLAQMKQQIQLAEQALQELAAEADGKKLEADVKLKIADLNSKVDLEKQRRQSLTDLEKARMDNATRIMVAEIGAKAKGVELGHDAEHEAVALAHEHAENEADRALQREQAAAAQQHEAAVMSADTTVATEEAEAARSFQAQEAEAARAADAAAAATQPEA